MVPRVLLAILLVLGGVPVLGPSAPPLPATACCGTGCECDDACPCCERRPPPEESPAPAAPSNTPKIAWLAAGAGEARDWGRDAHAGIGARRDETPWCIAGRDILSFKCVRRV